MQLPGVGFLDNRRIDIDACHPHAIHGSYYCCRQANIAQAHKTCFHIKMYNVRVVRHAKIAIFF